MIMLNFLILFVWTSVTLASRGHETNIEKDIASSPLIRQLLERVDILEKHNVKQEEEIQNLKADMVKQRGDMAKMRSKMNAKDKTIHSLLHKLNQADHYGKPKDEKTNQAILQTGSNYEGIEAIRKERSVDNRIRQTENEMAVAFSAGLSQHLLHVGDNQHIVFDHVITNVGNAYNPHAGLFVAPVAGIYVFSTSILSYDGRNNWATVVVNNTPKSHIYMHDDRHAMSSQTLVFDLKAGDDVGVQGHAGDAYQGESLPYTIFSGFLLQQNYTSPIVVG